jgi:hypothetical protein
VVEDEMKIWELLRSYLEREGFEVLSTGSVAEAMGLAQSAFPDLVVRDRVQRSEPLDARSPSTSVPSAALAVLPLRHALCGRTSVQHGGASSRRPAGRKGLGRGRPFPARHEQPPVRTIDHTVGPAMRDVARTRRGRRAPGVSVFVQRADLQWRAACWESVGMGVAGRLTGRDIASSRGCERAEAGQVAFEDKYEGEGQDEAGGSAQRPAGGCDGAVEDDDPKPSTDGPEHR